MYRFLVFSDLHLNAWTYGSTVSLDWNSRLGRQRDIVCGMLEYAKHNGINSVLFCGDFFHTPGRINTEVLEAAAAIKKATKTYGVHIYALLGNHDMKTALISSINVLEDPYFHPILYAEHFMTEDGIPVSAMPYTEDPEALRSFFAEIKDHEGHERVVMLHQGVRDVELNSKGFTLNEILSPDMIPENVIQAFAGHYHSYKRVSDKLIIPGSLMQLTWADKGETRGFLDVRYDGNIHVRQIDTSKAEAFSSFQVTGPAQKFVEVTSEWLLNTPHAEIESAVKNNFVRAISPIREPRRKQLETMHPASLEIVPVEDTEKLLDEVDVARFESMSELFEEYVVHCGIDNDLASVGRQIVNT